MTKENITAILECYFTGFKKEIIDSACNRILELEPCENITISIPDNASNGDVVKTIYPQEPSVVGRNGKYIKISGEHFSTIFDVEWWNAPYKENNNV